MMMMMTCHSVAISIEIDFDSSESSHELIKHQLIVHVVCYLSLCLLVCQCVLGCVLGCGNWHQLKVNQLPVDRHQIRCPIVGGKPVGNLLIQV